MFSEIVQVWESLGTFLQTHWDHVIDSSGAADSGLVLWFLGTALVSMLAYWLVGGVYLFMDMTGRPRFMRKYKVQEGTNEPVSWGRLKSALKLVAFNQIVVGPIFLFAFLHLYELRGPQDITILPPIWRILIELPVCAMCYETFFYYSHRTMHQRCLYRWIHKKHHEWKSPIAVTGIHCHPLEHFFGNLTPVFSGLLICGSHIVTSWIWLTFVTLLTLNDHSGYHVPFAFSSQMHDFHHLKHTNNFGVFGFWDRLHGTDSRFRKTKAAQRHMHIFSLKSARELISDD